MSTNTLLTAKAINDCFHRLFLTTLPSGIAVGALLVLACTSAQSAQTPPPQQWKLLLPELETNTPQVVAPPLAAPSPRRKPSEADGSLPRQSDLNQTDSWNKLALEMIRKYQQNPLRAGRVLAILHAAQHDALANAARQGLPAAGELAALHTASSAILSHSYPLETPGRFDALGSFSVTSIAMRHPADETAIAHGRTLGKRVAEQAIERALDDRADEIWDARQRPQPDEGVWRGVPPLDSAHPQEALAGEWRTWVLRDASQIQPPSPPAYDSAAHREATREVHTVAMNLTKDQKRMADDWHLDQGSVTPPGVWNLKARELANEAMLGYRERVRLFAALNVAMADASIACWKAKYTWWTARPLTAIRQRIDAQFKPYLVTPPHPSYVSGHASVSGAAAQVLKAFFSNKQGQIDAWANEAAMSRLYGGIHYRFDNEAGLALGRAIGDMVVARFNGGREVATAPDSRAR